MVAAAGNCGCKQKIYPAAYKNVIAVAATNNLDSKASFSTYDARWVDVAAPGENIFSTFPNHQFVIQTKYGRSQNYDFANGTSMASPMAAAAAALTAAGTVTASVDEAFRVMGAGRTIVFKSKRATYVGLSIIGNGNTVSVHGTDWWD